MSRYSIIRLKKGNVEIFIKQGDWEGVTLKIHELSFQGSKINYKYSILGFPSRLSYLIGKKLDSEQEKSFSLEINEIIKMLVKHVWTR